jgi:hypothetical protein
MSFKKKEIKIMLNEHFPAPNLIGQFRQFGEFGPAYKIVTAIRPTEDNDWLLLVKVFETGEEVEYRYSHIKNDPEAH